MKRTLVYAYLQGNGMSDEITTFINLDPLEAAKNYLNTEIVRGCELASGEWYEYKMKCTHLRTDAVQEWDGKEWVDITDKEPFAVGTWRKYGDRYIHIAPYNVGGKETCFN